MNHVLEVGRRARQQTRQAELRHRGRPVRRAVPRPRPSGRLRDTWPSAHLHRPAPATVIRLVGTRAERTTVAERATVPAAARVARPVHAVPVPVWTRTAVAPSRTAPTVAVPPPAEPPPVVLSPELAPVPAMALTSTAAPPAAEPVHQPLAAVPATEHAAGPAPESAVVEPTPEPTALRPVPDPTVAEPAPERSAVEPAPSRSTTPQPRRVRRWVAAAAAVVVVGGAVTTVVTVTRDGGTSPSVAAVDRSDVVSWLGANVPANASVATTDPALRRSVTGGQVTVAEVDAAEDLATGGYLVRAAGDADPAAPVALDDGRALVDVARFGDGSSAVLVAQVVGHSADDVTADQRTERDTARAATSGLLANAAVTVASSASPSFQAGQLDLRAAAFLALLANQTPVTVLDVRTDSAERVVGLADRRVVVDVADASLLRAAISSTRAPYSPELTTPAGLTTGSVLLTWPLLADPTSVVS